MRLSILGSLGITMLAGICAATPAFATPASISGSAVVSNPSTLTTAVSGESVLGGAYAFPNGNVIVDPTYTAAGAGFSPTALVVDTLNVSSTGALIISPSSSSFTAAAAAALVAATNGTLNPANLEAVSAIIRAGAGVDGLD